MFSEKIFQIDCNKADESIRLGLLSFIPIPALYDELGGFRDFGAEFDGRAIPRRIQIVLG